MTAKRKLHAALSRHAEWSLKDGAVSATFRIPRGRDYSASGRSRREALGALVDLVAEDLGRSLAATLGALATLATEDAARRELERRDLERLNAPPAAPKAVRFIPQERPQTSAPAGVRSFEKFKP